MQRQCLSTICAVMMIQGDVCEVPIYDDFIIWSLVLHRNAILLPRVFQFRHHILSAVSLNFH